MVDTSQSNMERAMRNKLAADSRPSPTAGERKAERRRDTG